MTKVRRVLTKRFDLARDGFEVRRATGAKIVDFQVFGERSSGTNYIESLLPTNLGIASFRNYAWKHGFLTMPAVAPGSLIVAVFREPVSWLQSMYRKPWHSAPALQSVTFSEFIRMEWKAIVDKRQYFGRYEAKGHGVDCIGQRLQLDKHPITGENFRNVIQMRSAKAAGLLGLRCRECNYVLVRHEAAVARTDVFLEAISSTFGLDLPAAVVPVERHYGGGFRRVAGGPPDLAEISEADRAFIRQELDAEIEARLGYAV